MEINLKIFEPARAPLFWQNNKENLKKEFKSHRFIFSTKSFPLIIPKSLLLSSNYLSIFGRLKLGICSALIDSQWIWAWSHVSAAEKGTANFKAPIVHKLWLLYVNDEIYSMLIQLQGKWTFFAISWFRAWTVHKCSISKLMFSLNTPIKHTEWYSSDDKSVPITVWTIFGCNHLKQALPVAVYILKYDGGNIKIYACYAASAPGQFATMERKMNFQVHQGILHDNVRMTLQAEAQYKLDDAAEQWP